MTISAAAATGNRAATLEAMRTKLAADMDEAPATVVAQIAARLQSVLAELDELATPTKASTLDDLEKRRSDRLAITEPATPARRPSRQRGA